MQDRTNILANQETAPARKGDIVELMPAGVIGAAPKSLQPFQRLKSLIGDITLGLIVLPIIFLLLYIPIALSPPLAHAIGAIIGAKATIAICTFTIKNWSLLFAGLLLAFSLVIRVISPLTHLVIRRDGMFAFATATTPTGLEEEYRRILSSSWMSPITELLMVPLSGLVGTVNWKTLEHVSIEISSKNAGANLMCFRSNKGKTTKLRLGDVLCQEARQKLCYALNNWAPQAHCDPEVVDLLESKTDKSYTELWFSALSAPPGRNRLVPLATGTTIGNGRYEICEELGVGGQGTTYIAKLPGANSDDTVVIKEYILPIHVARSAKMQAIDSLQHEARLLESIDHPQIVKLHDFFVDDNRGYLILKHIKGLNLRTLIDRSGPLSEAKTRKLLRELCDILEYLHTQNPPMIHRDLTPDNLIISDDGNLTLVDFNVAEQLTEGSVTTVAGKLAYMPPEQFKGKCVPQTDLYALGATAYFLLTGYDPEPLTTSHPRKDNNQVSQALDDVIARCTQLDTNARYDSAKALRRQLTEIKID